MADKVFPRPKTLRGVWGNTKYIVRYRTYGSAVVFTVGAAVGLIVGYFIP